MIFRPQHQPSDRRSPPLVGVHALDGLQEIPILMKRPLKIGLIAGFAAIITAGVIETALAKTENDLFQFCTTKAYGWPTPWKIDYCECEDAKTTFPASSRIENLSALAGSGLIGFALIGGISRCRQHRDSQEADDDTEEAV